MPHLNMPDKRIKIKSMGGHAGPPLRNTRYEGGTDVSTRG